jgi:hypothetical protein
MTDNDELRWLAEAAAKDWPLYTPTTYDYSKATNPTAILALLDDLRGAEAGYVTAQADLENCAGQIAQMDAENARLREALEEIRDSHIPSVPLAAAPVDDLVWAQQWVGHLRRVAKRALAGETKA